MPNTSVAFRDAYLMAPLKSMANFIYNMLTKHYSSDQGTMHHGGAPKKNKRRSGYPTSFQDIWNKLPISKLEVFAIKDRNDTDSYDVTIIISRRGQRYGASRKTVIAKMTRYIVESDTRTEKAIAALFEDWRWETIPVY